MAVPHVSLPGIASPTAGQASPFTNLMIGAGGLPQDIQQAQLQQLQQQAQKAQAAQAILAMLKSSMAQSPGLAANPQEMARVQQVSKLGGLGPVPKTPQMSPGVNIGQGKDILNVGQQPQISAPTGKMQIDPNYYDERKDITTASADILKFISETPTGPKRDALLDLFKNVPPTMRTAPVKMDPIAARQQVDSITSKGGLLEQVTNGNMSFDAFKQAIQAMAPAFEQEGETPDAYLNRPDVLMHLTQRTQDDIDRIASVAALNKSKGIIDAEKAKAELLKADTADKIAAVRLKYLGKQLEVIDDKTKAALLNAQSNKERADAYVQDIHQRVYDDNNGNWYQRKRIADTADGGNLTKNLKTANDTYRSLASTIANLKINGYDPSSVPGLSEAFEDAAQNREALQNLQNTVNSKEYKAGIVQGALNSSGVRAKVPGAPQGTPPSPGAGYVRGRVNGQPGWGNQQTGDWKPDPSN